MCHVPIRLLDVKQYSDIHWLPLSRKSPQRWRWGTGAWCVWESACMHGGRSDIIAHGRSRAFSGYHKRALRDIDPAVCLLLFFLFCSFSLSNWGTQSTRHHGNWRTETHLTVLSGIWTGIIKISVIMRSHDAWNICPFSKKRSLWYFVALSFA